MQRKAHTLVAAAVLLVGIASNARSQKANFSTKLGQCVEVKSLNVCLAETLEELRTLMPVGIPELQLRRSEPLEIENLDFKTRQGPFNLVNIASSFSNVVVRGLSKFETQRINVDTNTRTLSLALAVPRIDVTGNYDLHGKVFVFDVDGKGDFNTVLEGVTSQGTANVVPVGQPGQQRLSIQNTDIDFRIGKARVKLNNLFDGKAPDVDAAVHDFINNNQDLLLDEVKPQIRERLVTMVERVLNDALSNLPADQFLDSLQRTAATSAPVAGSTGPVLPGLPPLGNRPRGGRRLPFGFR